MKTNTLLTMLITALFLLPVITICQVPDIKFSCKAGKQTLTVPSDNDLLYGQLSTPSNEGPVASQDFNDSTAYSCQAADDFTVSEGETWLIDEVFFSGQYSPDGGPDSLAHLFIYLIDTLTNAPGVLVAELIDFPVTASPDGDLTFNIQQAPDIDPITLEQGHYWISVQPHMPYTPYKQWYWKKQENGPPNDDYPLHWRNPDGGFGLPYPDWTPSTVVFEGTLDHNLAFAIYGEKMVCPVVDAGEDATLCEGESFTASATAGNTCGLMWTTNGDGTFDNTGSASATYIPGIADIDLGGATLCLIGQACAPCTQNAQDCLEITIQEQPSVFAGNDFTVCEGDQVIFSEAAAINYGTLQWITVNGGGYFDDQTVLNPTYTPSPMDYAQGCISMALSVGPISPCTNYVIDFINVCFQPPPTADAGEDATIQEGEDYKLSATAGNTCGLIWTTSGDGSFDDDVSLSATYIPGVTDIANGSVTLCLSGAACAPCAQGIQDCLELTIEALPFVNAGPDATICVDPSKKTIGGKGCFPLTGIVTGTFNALQWYTINGTGYFDNEHTLSTCYYYSPFDVLQGPVIIVLAVDYKGSKSSLSDSMILTFQEIPTVDAGEDATICGELAYPLADANAANYADLLWVTYGTGTFSDSYSLNPTYSPSMIDIMLGSVELCLNAAPINPCETGVSDCIILTLLDGPTADAGEDATICGELAYPLADANAANYAHLLWVTYGTGTFSDPYSLNPTYTPSMIDIMLGSVELCLNAAPMDPCEIGVSDCIILTLLEGPTADAGEDATICGELAYPLADANAANYAHLLWVTYGTGTFSDPYSLNPTYTPSMIDIMLGSVELCLNAAPMDPCEIGVSDCIILTLLEGPTADAGEDATICGELAYPLADANAANYAHLLWVSYGTGTFSDPYSLNPTYYPGMMDVLLGSVELCLNAAPMDPCETGVSDCIILTLLEGPTADAGEDATICGELAYPLADANAANYAHLLWVTYGTGTFSDSYSLNPTYSPSMIDILLGSVELCLSAAPIDPCVTGVSDCMILTLLEGPTADAGEDATICGELAYPLADANAANYANLLWVTYGTGTFSDSYSLNPTYSPSMIDIMLGSAELCLNAAPINPCEIGVSDCMILTLLEGPTADAGEDATICGELAYPLADANAANYAHLLWVTYGTGTFSDSYSLNPTYSPSMIDILLGSVELCLSAAPIDPCVTGVSDCMILTLLEGPTADAGEDATICGELAYPLADANAANYADLLWVTYGTGTFSDSYSLNPTYSPSMIDIMLGSVELCLNAAPINPCETGVSDCIILTLLDGPTADAGEDATICGELAYPLADANAANYAHLLWVTYGTGTFSDPYSLNPTYTPSMIDIMLGSVELCLNAAPINPCETGVSDCIILTLLEGPTADAGEDATICGELAYPLADANAANYAHLLWVTYGTGTFSDSYSLNPTYSPSMIDILLGSVELCLSAAPIDPCVTGVSDCMILTLLEGPTADAGEDATICGELAYPLADANAANYANLLWVTYGTGTFSDSYSLNPTYSPSMIDIMLGSAELCLNAAPINPCETGVSDCVTLTFESGQQTVQVPSGWCGISTYLELHPGDLETILDPVIDDLVILYNFSGIFYPEYGIFTIDEWDTYSGYVGKFSSPTSLNFMGCDLENKTVHLNQAWNIIPVLSDQAYSVEDLFAGKDNLQIVKEVAGTGIYWPAYSINTLGNVLPGKAYYARMSAADSIDYAISTKGASTIKPPDLSSLLTPWNKIAQTPSSHIVVFELAEKALQDNDIIGGFTTDDTCAGLTKIQDASLPFAISLNADDFYIPEKFGFNAGELIAFRLFRTTTGEVFDLEVSYKPAFDHSGLFVPNGVSVVYDVKLSPAGISNSSKHELNIYPNPSNGTFTIEGIHEKINVRIFNAFGEEIYLNELNLPARVDLSAQPNGMYFIRIETHNRIFFEKLVIN